VCNDNLRGDVGAAGPAAPGLFGTGAPVPPRADAASIDRAKAALRERVAEAADNLDELCTRAEQAERELSAGAFGPAQDVDLLRARAVNICTLVARAMISPEHIGRVTAKLRRDPRFGERGGGVPIGGVVR
jgi:hypothetical protein